MPKVHIGKNATLFPKVTICGNSAHSATYSTVELCENCSASVQKAIDLLQMICSDWPPAQKKGLKQAREWLANKGIESYKS